MSSAWPRRVPTRKGRHTTTARQLIELPCGALLIDTPGMRELQPWADESAVSGAFEDIAALAGRCQFGDCAHAQEPGCAVREAVGSGVLDESRLESFRKLLREAAFELRKRDKSAAAEEKRRWKQIHQAQRARYKERDWIGTYAAARSGRRRRSLPAAARVRAPRRPAPPRRWNRGRRRGRSETQRQAADAAVDLAELRRVNFNHPIAKRGDPVANRTDGRKA